MQLLLLAAAAVIVLALGAWLRRPGEKPTREAWEGEDRVEPIDHAALEAAEREVQGRLAPPEDDEAGDDWGPGTGTA